MTDENQLSPAEKLALLAAQKRPEDPSDLPPLRMISLRLPEDVFGSIRALASVTGRSRNTTMISLLEAGLYAFELELSDDSPYFEIREHILGE